jgi:hypothetical protein
MADLSHILKVAERNDTRVGANDVQPTKVRDRLVKKAFDVDNFANVGSDGNGVGPQALYFLDNFLCWAGCLGIVHHYLGSIARELDGNGSTDAPA